MGLPKKPRKRSIRSGFLLTGQPGYRNDEPFRHSFTMQFPLRDQRALHLLAKLLHYKEDLCDEHCPQFRGSCNLAELRAASLDLQSIARRLAEVAAFGEEETSKRELLASAAADRFAVKLVRLAREIEAAMDEIAPPRQGSK